ncbi:MAG: MFS transporter [Nannocystaceae bacterium]|nr:MFS transporter [Nannocystaceae bacterium]
MSAVFELLRTRPNFRRLWLGSMVSQLGDWIGWVAVAMVALQGGGGPLDVAIVFAGHHLPAAVLTPVSGVVADRVDRRWLLCVASLGLGLVTIGMAAAAAMGAVGLLQLLLWVRSAGVAFVTPAERAALPRVVDKDELLLAGALDSASWSVVFAVGMAAGGAISMLGPVLALSIDALTFGVSALLFARLPKIAPEREPSTQRPELLRGIADAWAVVWPRPVLRRAVFAKTPFSIAAGAGWIALALQAELLGGAALGGLGFGLLHAARGIGTGVGPALVASRASAGGDRVRFWRVAVWVGLAGTVVVGFATHPVLLALAALVWGVGGGTNWVVSNEQFQIRTSDSILARTSALDQVGSIAGMTLGVGAVALLVEVGGALGLSVLIVVLPAAALWWWLDRAAVAGEFTPG